MESARVSVSINGKDFAVSNIGSEANEDEMLTRAEYDKLHVLFERLETFVVED